MSEFNPKEVSLFIGGREFVLDGVGEPHSESFYGLLCIARIGLMGEIADPEGSGRMLDMTTEETVMFLEARLEVLNWLIANIVPRYPGEVSSRGEPEEINYLMPG